MTYYIAGQLSEQGTLLDKANANGAGTVVALRGMKTLYLDLQKTGTGTCTALIEGSMDGTVFYTLGYQLIDATAAPARAVAAITIGATNPLNHLYQVLDVTKYLRVTVAATSGVYALSATVYGLPI